MLGDIVGLATETEGVRGGSGGRDKSVKKLEGRRGGTGGGGRLFDLTSSFVSEFIAVAARNLSLVTGSTRPGNWYPSVDAEEQNHAMALPRQRAPRLNQQVG